MGNWGFYYDDEKIIFALSRKDRREFRWEELQNAKADIFYPSSPAAWHFYFQDEKKTKKIAVTPRMAGYDEFVDMLKKRISCPKPRCCQLLNEESETNRYQEFRSFDLADIQRLRIIIGKRFYAVPYIDEENGAEYYNMVTE